MYEKLKIGDEFGPVIKDVNIKVIEKYLEALEEPQLCVGNNEMEDFIVSPSIVSIFQKDALGVVVSAGTIHAKQEYNFLAPIYLDDKLTTMTRITEKFLRKGKRWLVVELTTRNNSGQIVAIGKSWAIFP